MIVSICGPAGVGKSQLTLAIANLLGPDQCARVPADYFLVSTEEPLVAYFSRPLRYDWPLISAALALPIGATASTPDFDFESFQRLAGHGGRSFLICPVMLIDAMEPYPASDARVLLHAPDHVRQTRIGDRDLYWKTRVSERWGNLEATWARARTLTSDYDLELDGTRPTATNAELVASWILGRRTKRREA